ncbi:helix-turn-helix transcriptional regulator [Actinosynnema sp. NPDC050436]|uniref:helix-turn-helix domain-containing protein n=1 Tax=Actinosynnema sp. NPDC050436 TaxID=3155659 RepID=UPI0034114F5B
MAAPQERPGPEQVLSQEKFADALRAAIARRDLTLDRIRARLAERGVEISLATLSYWQQGRSRPERPKSLRALRELEAILDLPPNTLFDFLEPRRPRGRWLAEPGLSFAALYGEDSPARAVLGDGFANPNPDVAVLSTTEQCFVDARRSLRGIATRQVLRGVNNGCDRLLVVHGVTEGDVMPHDLVVRGGALADLRVDDEAGYVAAEIHLGRALAKNETAVVEYDWRMGGCDVPSRHHERLMRTATSSYLLQVFFDGATLPARCYEYRRAKVDAPTEGRRRLPIDPARSVHSFQAKSQPGIYGISWEWA